MVKDGPDLRYSTAYGRTRVGVRGRRQSLIDLRRRFAFALHFLLANGTADLDRR